MKQQLLFSERGRSWPPDYTAVLLKRQERFMKVRENPVLIPSAIDYYSTRLVEFVEDWCITYDPRNAMLDLPTTLPFVLFPRQKEFLNFLLYCLQNKVSGLCEKSRDMGATWLSCSFSVWLWRFKAGASVGWGSRKEALVDRLGDPDSIFEKIRMTIDHLPRWLWPSGFDMRDHTNYMKIRNPENGSTITGEAGDEIGRGGRKSIYFKDESAHYERPERIEAALGDNTDVQIDISSVNGTATIFQRRRKAGEPWPGKDKKKHRSLFSIGAIILQKLKSGMTNGVKSIGQRASYIYSLKRLTGTQMLRLRALSYLRNGRRLQLMPISN